MLEKYKPKISLTDLESGSVHPPDMSATTQERPSEHYHAGNYFEDAERRHLSRVR